MERAYVGMKTGNDSRENDWEIQKRKDRGRDKSRVSTNDKKLTPCLPQPMIPIFTLLILCLERLLPLNLPIRSVG